MQIHLVRGDKRNLFLPISLLPLEKLLLVQKYIVPEADLEDTLETHLYYLEPTGFLVKLYKQMKARIKVNVIEEKKRLFRKPKKEYVTKQFTIEQLTGMTKEEKEACGLVIQELSVSKFAIMGL